MADEQNKNEPTQNPGEIPADPNAPRADVVRYGASTELAPHEAMVMTPHGDVPRDVLVRRGSSKAAIATSFALVIIGLEITIMAPGVGLIYAVIALPIIIYMLRITRRPIENESAFRRAMATTGTTLLTILSAVTFTFLSVVTLIYIICSGTHL